MKTQLKSLLYPLERTWTHKVKVQAPGDPHEEERNQWAVMPVKLGLGFYLYDTSKNLAGKTFFNEITIDVSYGDMLFITETTIVSLNSKIYI
jgi:hypothetical protein